MDPWAVMVVVLGIITKASTVLSAKWQTSPDPVIYACKGRTVQFPWKLNFDPRSEFVENVLWSYQGTFTSNLLATYIHGQFLPALKYAGRVIQLQDHGVALRDVTPNDAGNYSVEAFVRQSNTTLVSKLNSQPVYLQVPDGVMVEGGRLEMTQDPVALWDMTSEQWTIRLWCGVFTFKGQPPVRVEWIIPSGDVRLSSGYTGGRFYLSLAAPVLPDGNYTCRVPQQFYPDLCPTDKRVDRLLTADLLRASIVVDEVRARLTLAEAEQGRLLLRQEVMMTNLSRDLHVETAKLDKSINSVKSDLSAEIAKQRQDKAELEDITNSIKSDLTDRISELLQMQQSLVKRIQELENDVCGGIIFTTINDANGVRNLNSSTSGNLCDKTMTAGWYRWLLQGQNATIPTSCTPQEKCGTYATMWIDLNGQPMPSVGREVQGLACLSWDSNCCWRQTPSVTVRNCGSYYIYYLRPPTDCYQAYCLQRQI